MQPMRCANSRGNVGVVAFCLQNRDGRSHGGDYKDSRFRVRKHIPNDIFWRLR
jgi:hypothetical protein